MTIILHLTICFFFCYNRNEANNSVKCFTPFVEKQNSNNEIKTTQIDQILSIFVCDSIESEVSSSLKTFSFIE